MGTKATHAFIAKACHEDLARPVEMRGWTASDIAKTLQEENDKHVWPKQLLSKKGQAKLAVVGRSFRRSLFYFSELRCLRAFSYKR